jgi:hypothetical protein
MAGQRRCPGRFARDPAAAVENDDCRPRGTAFLQRRRECVCLELDAAGRAEDVRGGFDGRATLFGWNVRRKNAEKNEDKHAHALPIHLGWMHLASSEFQRLSLGSVAADYTMRYGSRPTSPSHDHFGICRPSGTSSAERW